MRHSLYWDDFELRAKETADCLKAGKYPPPVRRVAVFITEGCNFRCDYCNVKQTPTTLSRKNFEDVLAKYGDTAIIHITGGEPSIVPWLYPLIESCSDRYRFHLNTNAFIMPPAAHVKRLKVSLDSDNEVYWDNLVGRTAWRRVCQNIQRASEQTVTSITYTLTAENYRDAPRFIQFANVAFPHLYAMFFSVYKGTHPRFVFQQKHIDDFFERIVPEMEAGLDKESLALFERQWETSSGLLLVCDFQTIT